ncbi:uncharacterized protein LOC124540810 [Vanessa cardui]|uniref:uncharacterized protein LOC124540810 n=1 Tax=Vanessa cardui TaxID=171605 RepID=UPI001F13266D|nr:uncharacterized protein LOC124540810 [Vanessa cardui]
MLLVVRVSTAMVTIILVVTARGDNEDINMRENKPKSLINALRRQLMHDNSDYSLEDTTSTYFRKHKELTRKNFYVSDLLINEREDEENNFTSNINELKKDNKKNIGLVVSKKDILYYIDDDKLPWQKSDEEYYRTESTAKYKMLKAKHQYRRSGQARLIQEENKEGVAIVNLDKGPFPELRLPNSRRQYMHDHGEVMTEEEEVPPPVVNTSDPEAAADEFGNATVTEITDIGATNSN